jgi:hypothetical protein
MIYYIARRINYLYDDLFLCYRLHCIGVLSYTACRGNGRNGDLDGYLVAFIGDGDGWYFMSISAYDVGTQHCEWCSRMSWTTYARNISVDIHEIEA